MERLEDFINDFKEERICNYRGRKYHVRDNGAVYRRCLDDGIVRIGDEEWTIGKPNSQNGYLYHGKAAVHRIVCTAFHGEPEGDRNIVDHIDTNKWNNRPDNLRWVTRMENITNNPITMAIIEVKFGSFDSFVEYLAQKTKQKAESTDFSSFRPVTPEEGEAYLEHWEEWSERPLEERTPVGFGQGEWMYHSRGKTGFVFKNWISVVVDKSEECSFPLAPKATNEGEDVIQKYREALVPNATFLISRYYETVVRDVVFFEKENILRVLSERLNAKRTPFYIFEIWPEDVFLYHRIVGKNKAKELEEAMHDLTKYHRQEWKYKANRPAPVSSSVPSVDFSDFMSPEPQQKEVKVFSPADNIEQRNWTTPTEFPMCPAGMSEKPLEAYKSQMRIDGIFCRNRYGDSFLKGVGYNPEGDALIVLTYQPDAVKKWYLCGIYIEGGKYIHESIGSYFYEDGGRKYFTLYTGGGWTGGEVPDDYL